MILKAHVPKGTYLALNFGLTMKCSDMILWKANEDDSGEAIDLFSTLKGETPYSDYQQDYNTTFNVTETAIEFTSTRLLDTNDTDDFVIPMDGSKVDMTWAIKRDSSKFVMHSEYGQFHYIFNSDGTVTADAIRCKGCFSRYSAHEMHGITMALTWGLLGLVMFVTKRYLKMYWTISHWVHSICGTVILISTLASSLYMVRMVGFENGIHNTFGALMIFLTLLTSIAGMITFYRNVQPEISEW